MSVRMGSMCYCVAIILFGQISCGCGDHADNDSKKDVPKSQANGAKQKTPEAQALDLVKFSHFEDIWPAATDSMLRVIFRGGRKAGYDGVRQISEALLVREKLVEDVITEKMKKETGVIDVLGWKVKRVTETMYLVSMTYKRNGRLCGWYFEVSLPVNLVRYINDNPELVKHYNIGVE